jgi:hypothetical protein
MAKKNSSILWTVAQTGDNGIGKDGRDQAQKNVGLDTLYSGQHSNNGYYVKYLHQDTTTNNIVAEQAQTATTYSSSSTIPISGQGVADAIDKLIAKANCTASQTVDEISIKNGKLSVTFQAIAIGGNQVTVANATADKLVKVDANGHLLISDYSGTDCNAVTYDNTKTGTNKADTNRTLVSLQQDTNGQISAQFGDIAIGGDQVKISGAAASEFVCTDSNRELIHSNVFFDNTADHVYSIVNDDYLLIGHRDTSALTDTWHTSQIKFKTNDPYTALGHDGKWNLYTTSYIHQSNNISYPELKIAKLGIEQVSTFDEPTGTFTFNPCVTGIQLNSGNQLATPDVLGYLVPPFTSQECTISGGNPVDNTGKVLAITKVNNTEKLAWEYRSGPYILNMMWIDGGNYQFPDLSSKLSKLLNRLIELCNSSEPMGDLHVPDSMIQTGDTTKTMAKGFVYKTSGDNSTVEWHDLIRVEKSIANIHNSMSPQKKHTSFV